MITKCRICGKEFEVLYPELWRYVRAKRYLCSWKCLRLYDQKGSEDMYTKVKKDGTPAKKPGPAPKMITDPDVEAKLPEGPLEIETKEPEKVSVITEIGPEFEDRCTVSAIRVEGLGEFYYDRKFKSIDWRTEGGDEVSMGPAWWMQLVEDLPKILEKLGVPV